MKDRKLLKVDVKGVTVRITLLTINGIATCSNQQHIYIWHLQQQNRSGFNTGVQFDPSTQTVIQVLETNTSRNYKE